MRPATLEERENLCRISKRLGGEELLTFLDQLSFHSRRVGGQAKLLSLLANCPGKTDVPEERIKRVARRLHGTGVEVTPEEVQDQLESACHKIRLNLEGMGWDNVPESDVSLLELIGRLGAFT